MDEFMRQYLRIMKDLAEAADQDKDAEECKVQDAVDALIELFEAEGRTCYQAVLLCIQITWWANPKIHGAIEDYGKQVPALCQEIREAELDFKDDSALGEVLKHLEMEASEAVAYVREQAERVGRRSRALKWADSYVHRDVLRPRVVPRSRRVVLEQRHREAEGLEYVMKTDDDDDDTEGSDSDEDDLQEGEEYCGVETDDFDADEDGDGEEDREEDGEDETMGERYAGTIANKGKHNSNKAKYADNSHLATLIHGSDDGTIDSINTSDEHKMALISNDGDIVAEISDLESSVYIKAFIQCWNDDPATWRKHIDLWEQSRGIPGRSILHCLKREDGQELHEMGGFPLCMSVRRTNQATLKESKE